MERVVLTGATGFIGSAALRALLERGVRVRALVRRVPCGVGGAGDGVPVGAGVGDGVVVDGVGAGGVVAGGVVTSGVVAGGVEWVVGDLTEPGVVRGLCEGADAVAHLASYIGSDPGLCEAVNVDGTRLLMAEARRAGVGRVVQLSTSAVYGAGPHSGIDVDEIPAAPVSPVSRTRLIAEGFAREAGGVVLRPGLVLGAGDRWVVPMLGELLTRVPAVWDGGRALLSAVEVNDLGRLIAALATGGHRAAPGVHHASHPAPVRIGDLLTELSRLAVLPPLPTEDWPWDACLTRFRATQGRAGERQFTLVARDHWYRSDEIWHPTACPAGPGVLPRLAESAGWYRERMGEA